MQINKIQNTNQTHFGIKYINKRAWNKDVLKAFEESKLLKDINEKYPDAEIRYKKMSGKDSIWNTEIINTLLINIKLAKNKFLSWSLSSNTEILPEKLLKYELKTLNLKDLEEGPAEEIAPKYIFTKDL